MIGPVHDIFEHYISGEEMPPKDMKVALNMIVGETHEPYLAAALEALYDQVDWAVINFNAPLDPKTMEPTSDGARANLQALLDCRFNMTDRITLSSAPFRNYAFNRNLCLELSWPAKWIVQFDPDEIVYPGIVQKAIKTAEDLGATRILAHYWHCVKSLSTVQNKGERDGQYFKPFIWKNSPARSWFGTVHERMVDLDDRDLHLPEELWVHLGYVNAERVFAKWVKFSEISGQPNQYAGYFNDPAAPWRSDPSKILDDRKLYPFDLPLPPVIEPLREILGGKLEETA